METEQGKIIHIRNGNAIIELEAGSQCFKCQAKESCHTLTGDTTRQIEIPILNSIDNLKEGDKITLSFQPQGRILSAFLVFIMPLLFLITGYFLGIRFFGTESKAIMTSLAGLLAAFMFLWIINKTLIKDKKFIPTILKENMLGT